MEKIIQKIKSNTLLTIATTILLGLLIIFLTSITANFFKTQIGNYVELNFYTKNVIGKFFMLFFSIVLILIVNKGKFENYGFSLPTNVKYTKFIFVTIGICIASFILGNIIFTGILSHLFPTENTTSFPKQSILQMILTVWIWSTVCEEVFVRGLLQGFMQHLKSIKFLKLSLPVIISGLFFGAMHLSLLKVGMGHWFVAFIVFNTTVIGLLAAFYREKTNSLITPIIVHFLANVVGTTPFIIMTVLGKV
ncbi:MAG: CPBP family intramembrane metalloprotease [Bacteroidetes bacterium]|nr:CPBP family intramembrane metalloprotease [Bacteroidota bacterium]